MGEMQWCAVNERNIATVKNGRDIATGRERKKNS